jgi:hypothetical protein
LTGFLAPTNYQSDHNPDDDDEDGAGDDQDEELEAGSVEPIAKRAKFFPSSIGISVQLPIVSRNIDLLKVTVHYADYEPISRHIPSSEVADETTLPNDKEEKNPKYTWKRVPIEPVTILVSLHPEELRKGIEIPNSKGLRIVGDLKENDHLEQDINTRSLALFLVNNRPVEGEKKLADKAFVFQVVLTIEFAPGFLERPNRRGEFSDDSDERTWDLQFRDKKEYAVGHGIAVRVEEKKGKVTQASTTWFPQSKVHRIDPHELGGVETSMENLAGLDSPQHAKEVLSPLPEAYQTWLNEQLKIPLDSDARREWQKELVTRAEAACLRIKSGIDYLIGNPLAWKAFQIANRAMARSARQRSPERYSETVAPRWRLFQLAFLLLNLPGIIDETHPDREKVELIFFPTGGGKTEAYLGVIAFLLVYRRLLGKHRADRGLGVAVLLRYTLRLLTLDQLSRAATMICALEIERKKDIENLGNIRFSVGLWVGRSATANTLREVAIKVQDYLISTQANANSPFPLTNCPWCREPLQKSGFSLLPSKAQPKSIVVACSHLRCAFNRSQDRSGLPVLFVDEQIYNECPSFLVATVDKFAMLPWRGETGTLFGKVNYRTSSGFLGPMSTDAIPKAAELLPEGLRPPEMIVQDELHLISGPLGTMVGLYETAIEQLCSRSNETGKVIVPKILSSTATIRRARQQISALFGRAEVDVFPPPVVNESETFFSKANREAPARLYVGIAAGGRPVKNSLLNSYLGLLCSSYHVFRGRGSEDISADPYLSLVGYFNSLRELGGMRRVVEDEVRTRCTKIEDRKPLNFKDEQHPWFLNRSIQPEAVELTSREPTYRIAQTKHRLETTFLTPSQSIDVLLASNMISVGVDIDRLGLMVVAGQPKTTSEYIQATSRVGRSAHRPGLVVTVFNLNKPRDRSHYERFASYHESFYRHVEATSLTPFSGPALDRGLAGVLIAMIRLSAPNLTPPRGVGAIGEHLEIANKIVETLAQRAQRDVRIFERSSPEGDYDPQAAEHLAQNVRNRAQNLLDAWQKLIEESKQQSGFYRYSPYDTGSTGKALLTTPLHAQQAEFNPTSDEAKFQANTSMRDVEASVHLWRCKLES